MKKRAFVLFVAFLSCCDWVMAQTVMHVAAPAGTELYFPLIKEIYAEMGYSVAISILPAERALKEADSGKEYGAHVGITLALLGNYPNLVATKESLIDLNVQGWVKKGADMVIRTPDDLKRYRVGLVRGSKAAEAMVAAFKLEGVQTANSGESLAKMLDAGRFDVALMPSVVSSPRLQMVATLAAPQLTSAPVFHVLNKKNAVLVSKFDAVLLVMKKDGRLARLLTTQPNAYAPLPSAAPHL